MAQKMIYTSSSAETSALFGAFDAHVKKIEEKFPVKISNISSDGSMGDAIIIQGEEPYVSQSMTILTYLQRMVSAGDSIEEQSVDYVIDMVYSGEWKAVQEFASDVICITHRGKPIKAKTVGQKAYVEAIKEHTITFGIGPAGTGKTFLAVAMAVDAIKTKTAEKIILTRPAVEAGEKLGFLPGDLQNKIDPYLRPLYDALFEMLGGENFSRYMEKNAIEIAPLAYMRGRTLDNSFIILDEAQNTTPEQMKMFLTRLGYHSKVVVTGDPTQTDLMFGKQGGLSVATKILRGIEGIAVHTLTENDVVRHRLVRDIIRAYDKYNQTRQEKNTRKKYVTRKEEK